MNWNGKRIWVVGASSGIGKGLVNELSKRGSKLIISARRTELLQAIADVHSETEIKVLPADLEQHDELPAIAQKAWSIFGGLDYVFLNAGMSVRDLVSETMTEAERKVMDINFWGPVIITKELLPQFIKSNEAHIVVTSSLSGKYGVPKLASYAASKHALHGYFDSLRTETFKTGLKIHIAIPGFIKTNITVAGLKGDGTVNGQMQQSLEKGMDADKCAEIILKNLAKGKEEFVVGGSERHTVFINRLFPGLTKRMIRSRPLKTMRNLRKRVGL